MGPQNYNSRPLLTYCATDLAQSLFISLTLSFRSYKAAQSTATAAAASSISFIPSTHLPLVVHYFLLKSPSKSLPSRVQARRSFVHHLWPQRFSSRPLQPVKYEVLNHLVPTKIATVAKPLQTCLLLLQSKTSDSSIFQLVCYCLVSDLLRKRL